MEVRAGAGPRQQTVTALMAELASAAGRQDPYPVYARLRELAPVACLPAEQMACLTRYEDCAAVPRDGRLGAQGPAFMDATAPGWRDHPGLRATHESFVFRDPPEHTRLRRLVAGWFTQRRAEELRAFIERRTAVILAALADATSDGGVADLHDLLATTLPIAVISKVVGVPEADQRALRTPLEGLRLAVDGSSRATSLAAIDSGGQALISYFAGLAGQRREQPRDDLVSALVAVRDGASPPLSEDELLQSLALIFSAAIESMADLLLNAVAALLAFPAQAGRLRADPGLAGPAATEALRYDPPVQAIGRITASALELGGTAIPAGTLVLAMIGAANRDPAAYPDPDAFRIGRAGPAPLSFGGGVHHCLGAPLARLEAAIFLPALLRGFPGLAHASPPVRRGFVLRGFAAFPVITR
ncbi:MAG TPA: cytochrome P450 [Streptosporangiaceae bacterium]|jgi:cytochrome P450